MGIPVNKIIRGKSKLFLYKFSKNGSLLKKVISQDDFDKGLREVFEFIDKKEFYFVVVKNNG